MRDPGSNPGNEPLVLVVDDDPGTRLLAVSSLKQAGYATVEAADGRDGVTAFERLRPDVVLMDAQMPGMDGFTAVREIRKHPGGERIPVLMMTETDDLASIQRAYEDGVTDFAAKPIHWMVLGYRVGYILRASRAFQELAGSEATTRALLLKEFGCRLAQGHYFSRPLPANEFTGLLESNRRTAT